MDPYVLRLIEQAQITKTSHDAHTAIDIRACQTRTEELNVMALAGAERRFQLWNELPLRIKNRVDWHTFKRLHAEHGESEELFQRLEKMSKKSP